MNMTRDICSWIDQRTVLVGDGGMGSMLLAAGLAPGESPERWNLERPDAIAAVIQAYREAGAEVLETNTFGGTALRLEAHGLADQCFEINRAAAETARQVAGDDALVLGSMGPTGALLQPLGPLSTDDAYAAFLQQAEALAEGGADALCVETMTDITEAGLAVKAAATTNLPVLATMTFDETPRGFFTMMGITPQRAADELEEAGAIAIGTNCGTGPEPLVEVVRQLRASSQLPILVQPNAGLPEYLDGELRYPLGPEGMASFVARFIEAGANIIGGCCGSTPDHIRALAEAIVAQRSAD